MEKSNCCEIYITDLGAKGGYGIQLLYPEVSFSGQME
jgi:hypothetical protein